MNLSRFTNGLACFLVQQLVLAAPLKRHHPAETDRTDMRVHAYGERGAAMKKSAKPTRAFADSAGVAGLISV